MSDIDLTRWNRSGLSKFRYVDGNAATFLENLRELLASGFPEWSSLQDSPSVTEDLDSLVAQYHKERGDYGWEIARSTSRAVHVLAEYLDAYANEGYLGTATQWDHVRRLVEMIDYHPAPPASASTMMVIEAKDVVSPNLLVPEGLAFKHSPADGSAPVVFESLADLEVDSTINEIHVTGWNRSVSTFREDIFEVSLGVGSLEAAHVQGMGSLSLLTLEELAELAPPVEGLGMSTEALWECVTKARLVLSVEVDKDTWEPIRDTPVADILARTSENIAGDAGRTVEEAEALLLELHKLQLAFDEELLSGLPLKGLMASSASEASPLWIATEEMEISAGQLGLVVGGTNQAAVITIEAVEAESFALELADSLRQPDWRAWTKGESTLRVSSKNILTPWLNGPDVVGFEKPHGLTNNELVAWKPGTSWTLATVIEADSFHVRLSGENLPAPGMDVYRTLSVEGLAGKVEFPEACRAVFYFDSSGYHNLENDFRTIDTDDNEHGVEAAYCVITSGIDTDLEAVSQIHLVSKGAEPVGTIAATVSGAFGFDGSPGDLAGEEWVIVDDGSYLHALRIRSIEEGDGFFLLTFHSAEDPTTSLLGKPVAVIEGVVDAYAVELTELGVNNISGLLEMDLSTVESEIPDSLLAEFQLKARLVRDFSFDATHFQGILACSLTDVLINSSDQLSQDHSVALEEADDLLDGLRLLQIALDDAQLSTTTLSDLVPQAGVITEAGTEIETLLAVHGPFQCTIHPCGWDRDLTSLSGSVLPIELGDAEEYSWLLGKGRSLILEKEITESDGVGSTVIGYEGACSTSVVEMRAESGELVILDSLDEASGFTKGNLVVRGNVVSAGHGERKPEKVLGSGNATLSNQVFVLKEDGLAFVADATQSSGVRADIEVVVDGWIWHQAAALRDSEPTDAHFEGKMTEDGFLQIQFGDGEHGRRLPTGANNVRVGFRSGSGLSGNLSAGSLEKLAKPHYLVESVRQPVAANGGNDMENAESLRENAPATVLTMDRAVSLSDFARLAASQSSVWQANSFLQQNGNTSYQLVEVVVVPAGGGSLGTLTDSLVDFLQTHAIPGTKVDVTEYEPIVVSLEVTAQVIGESYDPEIVLQDLRDALIDSFSLQARKLGQTLYLSEVYGVVELVEGIENSTCIIDGDASKRVCRAANWEVIHLAGSEPGLILETTEFAL